jgi:hypothetical protein
MRGMAGDTCEDVGEPRLQIADRASNGRLGGWPGGAERLVVADVDSEASGVGVAFH